jgi:hypothetical protein
MKHKFAISVIWMFGIGLGLAIASDTSKTTVAQQQRLRIQTFWGNVVYYKEKGLVFDRNDYPNREKTYTVSFHKGQGIELDMFTAGRKVISLEIERQATGDLRIKDKLTGKTVAGTNFSELAAGAIGGGWYAPLELIDYLILNERGGAHRLWDGSRCKVVGNNIEITTKHGSLVTMSDEPPIVLRLDNGKTSAGEFTQTRTLVEASWQMMDGRRGKYRPGNEEKRR